MKLQTESQLKGRWGELVAAFAFPPHWVVRPLPHDFGIDLQVEVFNEIPEKLRKKNGARYTATGGHIACQVKTSDSVTVDGDTIPFKCLVADLTLSEAMGASNPLLLLLVDRRTKLIYYVCLTDYVRVLDAANSGWRANKHVTIRIPTRNLLDASDLASIPTHWKYFRGLAFRSKLYSFFVAMRRITHEVAYSYEAFRVAGESGVGHEPVIAALLRLDEQVAIARKASSDATAQELIGPGSPYEDLFVSLRGWLKGIGDFDVARDELLEADVENLPGGEYETLIVKNALNVQWALKKLELSETLPTLYEDFHRRVRISPEEEVFEE